MCERFCAAIGRRRLLEVTAFFAITLLSLVPASAAADDDHHHHSLRFMIQNLYAGSFFQEFLAAKTPSEIIAAATLTYQHIVATRPAERAVVIADEIAKLRPDFVSLHQAAILRTGALNAPPATTVTFDLLQTLLQELAARGVRYEAVAVRPGLDAEVPTALGFDIRLALRDVLIVRADLLEEGHVKLSNLQIRQYIAASIDTEGYSSIDVTWRGRQFRFVTTHFVALSGAAPQALELVQTAANTTLPVVLVCDCNANPDNPADPIFFQNYPAYLLLKNAGFVDVFRTARPNDPGFTCCQDENLLNVTFTLSHRIDLVQFRGPFKIEDVRVVGASPADRLRLGLWPSDHAGVVATLTLRSRDDADQRAHPVMRAPH
jgi:endonuclease/exonuclease/phosphatase family metal-dependent hydrolase